MKGEHSITLLCDILAVSRSGYYKNNEERPTARQREDQMIAAKIVQSHRESRGNYGAPRIVEDLREMGTQTSRRRCARLLRELGLRGRKKHRKKPCTTDSRHGQAVAENLLPKRPIPSRPDEVWVTDITCVETREGWLYISVILDAWSRRVVGWACASTMHASLVVAALNQALRQREPRPGILHHSDRGSQYVETRYIQTLEGAGFTRSMSRAGNCYDNAMMESFWSTLKTEAQLDVTTPATRREAKLAVFDYIETFYNPKRRHSSLGYVSPVAFEKQQSATNSNAA